MSPVAFFGSAFSGTAAASYIIWLGVAFVVMAILLRVFAGRELGRKPEAATDTMAAEQPVDGGIKIILSNRLCPCFLTSRAQ